MKKAAPWLVLAAFVIAGLYLLDQNRAARQILKAKLEASEAANAKLNDELQGLASRVEASEAARIADAAAAARREQMFIAELARVKTATPQQLIDDGSRLLRATDITLSLDGKTVSMGLETWRGAVSFMLTGDEYLKEKKPAWEAQVRGYADTIAGLKESVVTYQKQVAGFEGTIKEISKLTPKKVSTFEKVLWAGAGFGFGMLVEKTIK